MDFIRWVMPEALPDMKDISFGKDVVARAAPVQEKLPLISSLGPSGYPVGQHASGAPRLHSRGPHLTSAEPAEAARLRQGFGGHPLRIPPRLEPTPPK